MKKSLSDAIETNNIRIIDDPEYSSGSLLRGTPFEFTAIMDVYPTVELGKYVGISIEEKTCEIKESDIQNELNNFCEQHAKLEKLPDSSKIENGNCVKLNVQRLDAEEGSEEAVPRDFTIIIGKSKDVYSLDKHVIGLKVEQEKETEIKYPKDYHIQEYAGKKIKYKVKPLEISKVEIPILSDELVKEKGFESVEDLKQMIRKQMESFIENRTMGDARAEIIETIVKDSKFDIPNSMVTAEIDNVFAKSKESISARSGIPMEKFDGIPPDRFASFFGQNPEEYKQMLAEQAINSIKSSLVLREIARKEELKVSEEKYNSFINKCMADFGKSAQEIEDMIEKNGSRDNIEYDLMMKTVVDYLYDNAKVKKLKPMSFNELLKTK
jgi:trigger factor